MIHLIYYLLSLVMQFSIVMIVVDSILTGLVVVAVGYVLYLYTHMVI